jgi:hypothetical protein
MEVNMLEDINEDTELINIESFGEIIDGIQPLWSADILKNEPMFHKANYKFAYENGGEITKQWLDHIGVDGIIDTRVHMLMPNFWPCIPGWHHDDVRRTLLNKQPNYDDNYHVDHIVTIVGDKEVSNTEFAFGDCPFPKVDGKVYQEWSPMVDEAIADGFLESELLKYGDIILHDNRTWHRGTQATDFGWRWFARISFGSERKIANEIRNQTQIYLSDPVEGW